MVVVYQPHGFMARWSAEYTTALADVGSLYGFDVNWRPPDIYGPWGKLYPELTAATTCDGDLVALSTSQGKW